ncbi:MAG: hypothetical protein ABH851_03895 [Methanobacteriota archaeon]
MGVSYSTITVSKDETGITYECNFCGKKEGPIPSSRIHEKMTLLRSWVRIEPVGYSVDEKYNLILCGDCARAHNLMVGENHPSWNEVLYT